MLTETKEIKEMGTLAGKNGEAPTPITSPKEALAFARQHDLHVVDLKFVDFLGLWRHVSVPLDVLDEGSFEEGIGYDGSSIIGFQGIEESDLILIPGNLPTRRGQLSTITGLCRRDGGRTHRLHRLQNLNHHLPHTFHYIF